MFSVKEEAMCARVKRLDKTTSEVGGDLSIQRPLFLSFRLYSS